MEPGSILDGRFRLDEPIGEGGMGSVWRGFDLKLEGPVAVKLVPLARLGGRPFSRFTKEAKAAAQLRSPNVVQVIDHGKTDTHAYIAMELLAGESLKERLQRGALTPEELIELFEPLAGVLERAHDQGIVHRDLKPGNIQLVPEGERTIVKVLDFGIAKIEGAIDDETKTGALMGTPFYMSPEQLRDSKNVDRHADLWALAIIAYEGLIGVRPFVADTVGALAHRLFTQPAPVPSEHGEVPPGLDGWFARATSLDTSNRFQSATEMLAALRVALGDEPTSDGSMEETVTVGAATRDVTTMRKEVDAATTSRKEAPDRSGLIWFVAASAVAAALYLVVTRNEGETAPATTKTVSSVNTVTTAHRAVPTADASAAAPSETQRFSAYPCGNIEQLDDPPTCKDASHTAWCNRDHKRIACCSQGLVPLERDGACVCPPGGTKHEEAKRNGCEDAVAFDKDGFQSSVRAFIPELKKCYELALKHNEKLGGKVSFHLSLDATGRVFEARIEASSLPDADAQRCFVSVWSRAQFVPPAEGSLSLTYPVTFSNE